MSTPSGHSAVVRSIHPQSSRGPSRIFCGHCGRSHDAHGDTVSVQVRVCPTCGMGLLLEASLDAAPTPSDPFLVVDSSLTVCGVSRKAERVLGLSEPEAVNRHIADFLAPGETEGPEGHSLATTLTWAARGDAQVQNVVVRPTNTFGVRYWARIGSCGPPPAALLVLADAR